MKLHVDRNRNKFPKPDPDLPVVTEAWWGCMRPQLNYGDFRKVKVGGAHRVPVAIKSWGHIATIDVASWGLHGATGEILPDYVLHSRQLYRVTLQGAYHTVRRPNHSITAAEQRTYLWGGPVPNHLLSLSMNSGSHPVASWIFLAAFTIQYAPYEKELILDYLELIYDYVAEYDGYAGDGYWFHKFFAKNSVKVAMEKGIYEWYLDHEDEFWERVNE